MGKAQGKGRSQRLHDKLKERKQLDDAVAFIIQQSSLPPTHPDKHLSKRAVAIRYGILGKYRTLINRLEGKHTNAHKAHEKQQSLSHVQEAVIVEWLIHLSGEGKPVRKKDIRRKISEFTAGLVRPGRKWIDRFMARNPQIKLGKPSGLDPKRAQAFNRATVTGYFKLIEKVLTALRIPWGNVYNMDEKGCQRGGGRRASPEKFFIPRDRRPAYRTKSDNLELVTIIECVNAEGGALKPGFVFPGKEFRQGWMEVDDEIW